MSTAEAILSLLALKCHNQLSASIVVLGESDQIVIANELAERNFALDGQTLLGRRFSELLAPVFHKIWSQQFVQYVRGIAQASRQFDVAVPLVFAVRNGNSSSSSDSDTSVSSSGTKFASLASPASALQPSAVQSSAVSLNDDAPAEKVDTELLRHYQAFMTLYFDDFRELVVSLVTVHSMSTAFSVLRFEPVRSRPSELARAIQSASQSTASVTVTDLLISPLLK
jgi:hypothetical protein